ncbi:MAG: lysoplasmalogenase, partial [Hyphomonadaceae bacterium]|nr:lysoplasmalogenase [Hyphomonadaceae bacterium]
LTGSFVIILAMGISALALPPGMGTGVILAGAALFILSDMVLGVELFRLSATSRWRPFTSRVIWFTYYSGQVLIALGTIMVAIVEVVF